jgi:hypothetical protein
MTNPLVLGQWIPDAESDKDEDMPRIDDYKQALELGRAAIREKDPDLLAGLSGASIHRDTGSAVSLKLLFLNQEILVSWPGMRITAKHSAEELPIQQQILVLHYLFGAFSSDGIGLTGEWIAFQDIPDGKFYLDAFQRRAKIPMVQTFGERPNLLLELGKETYGATQGEEGDLSIVIRAFPLVELLLMIWERDDEFPPEGNILFDRNIVDLISAEDTAWLAGMVVYPLMGMAEGRG